MGDEHLKFREHPQDLDLQRGVPLGNSLISENVILVPSGLICFWKDMKR